MNKQVNVAGAGKDEVLGLRQVGLRVWIHIKHMRKDEDGNVWASRDAPAPLDLKRFSSLERNVCGTVRADGFWTVRESTDWSLVKAAEGPIEEKNWMRVKGY